MSFGQTQSDLGQTQTNFQKKSNDMDLDEFWPSQSRPWAAPVHS